MRWRSWSAYVSSEAPGWWNGRLAEASSHFDAAMIDVLEDRTLLSATVIDDGDAGYASSGLWTSATGGYQNDFRYATNTGGLKTAQWSFDGLTDGVYRVSASWIHNANRASDAPCAIRNGSGALLGTASMNQKVAPNDLAEAGVAWEDLGTLAVANPAGHTGPSLTVSLANTANGIVGADAIRVERVGDLPTAGELSLDVGDAMTTSGATVNVGSILSDGLALKTIRVTNLGSSGLTLQPASLSGTGFSLASNFGVDQFLAPGASANLTVQFSAVVMGDYTGSLSFTSDDADESTVNFNLTAAVVPWRVVDDGDSTFSTLGLWSGVTGNGYQSDFRYATNTGGLKTATWAFQSLTPGRYRVSATWVSSINYASNSPYYVTVFDGTADGVLLGTTELTQETAPNDFSAVGANWENIGEYDVTGQLVTVRLTNVADQTVIADAIRLERIGDLPGTGEISVSSGPDLVITDGGSLDFGSLTAGQTATRPVTLTNVGAGPLTLAPASLVGTGFSLASNITSGTTLAAGQSITLIVNFIPTMMGAHAGTLTLNSDDANEASYEVQLTGVLSSVIVVDDGDDDHSASGTWIASTGGAQNDFHYAANTGGASTATWNFAHLTPGQYRVSGSWIAATNRASNAVYQATDPVTSTVTSLAANQTVAPNDLTENGVAWEHLGLVNVTDSTLAVSLSNAAANGLVIADAVRIERLGLVTGAGELIVLHNGQSLASPNGTIDFGSTPSGSPVDRTILLKNLGDQPLTVQPLVAPAGFTVVDNVAANHVIAAGGQQAVTLRLNASAVGPVSGTLAFTNDDANESPFSLNLTADVTPGNLAPTDVTFSPTTVDLPESADTSVPTTLTEITVVDDGAGANQLSLSGPHADLFQLAGTTLQLKAGVVLDYETQSSYGVVVNVNDPAVGGSIDASAAFSLNITNVNEPPSIAPQTFSVDEHAPVGTVVGTVTASDPDANSTLTFSLLSDPSSKFSLNPQTGQLRLLAPLFAMGNQSLNIVVTASDSSLQSSQPISVNVAPGPALSRVEALSTARNGSASITLPVLTDGNGAALTPVVSQPPAFGTATIAGGSVVYRPNAGYTGADSFLVARGANVVAFVSSVTPPPPPSTTPTPPTPTETRELLVYESEAIYGQGPEDRVEYFGDPDTDTYTTVITPADVITPPEHGTLTYDSATRQFTYTPEDGFVGEDSFQLGVVPDSIVEYNVSVYNHAPFAGDDEYRAVTGETYTFKVTRNDGDVGPLTVEILEQPTVQTYDADGNPISYSLGSATADDDKIEFSPTSAGSGVIKYRVTDQHGAHSNEASVFVTVLGTMVTTRQSIYVPTVDVIADLTPGSGGVGVNLPYAASVYEQLNATLQTAYATADAAYSTARNSLISSTANSWASAVESAGSAILAAKDSLQSALGDSAETAEDDFVSSLYDLKDSKDIAAFHHISAINSLQSVGPLDMTAFNYAVAASSGGDGPVDHAVDDMIEIMEDGAETVIPELEDIESDIVTAIDEESDTILDAADSYMSSVLESLSTAIDVDDETMAEFFSTISSAYSDHESELATLREAYIASVSAAQSTYISAIEDAADAYVQAMNYAMEGKADEYQSTVVAFIREEVDFRDGMIDGAAWGEANRTFYSSWTKMGYNIQRATVSATTDLAIARVEALGAFASEVHGAVTAYVDGERSSYNEMAQQMLGANATRVAALLANEHSVVSDVYNQGASFDSALNGAISASYSATTSLVAEADIAEINGAAATLTGLVGPLIYLGDGPTPDGAWAQLQAAITGRVSADAALATSVTNANATFDSELGSIAFGMDSAFSSAERTHTNAMGAAGQNVEATVSNGLANGIRSLANLDATRESSRRTALNAFESALTSHKVTLFIANAEQSKQSQLSALDAAEAALDAAPTESFWHDPDAYVYTFDDVDYSLSAVDSPPSGGDESSPAMASVLSSASLNQLAVAMCFGVTNGYREDFLQSLADTVREIIDSAPPEEWPIHHRYQQGGMNSEDLLKLYKEFIGDKFFVNQPDNLFAVPRSVHKKINEEQRAFWRRMRVKFTGSSSGAGDHIAAVFSAIGDDPSLRKQLWGEYAEFVTKIDKDFGGSFLKHGAKLNDLAKLAAGSNEVTSQILQYKPSTKAMAEFADSVKNVKKSFWEYIFGEASNNKWTKRLRTAGRLAVFYMISEMVIGGGVATASEIRAGGESGELKSFTDQYRYIGEKLIAGETVSANQWTLMIDAFQDYLKSLPAYDENLDIVFELMRTRVSLNQ